MAKRQYTTPVVVKGNEATVLSPIPPEEIYEDEKWFQRLLFSHPSLLPIDDIEPGFSQLVPIARELPTLRGPLDLLFADSDGHLILVETKLWRNPEARRKVVGQIVDYATDISRWSYGDLVEAVREVSELKSADPLLESVRGAMDASLSVDEARFIDAVSLNLSRGRFLLLIVGDGIHEGVEQMVEFLGRYPQLGFRLALVEIALYRLGNSGDLFVQPRVVATTREVVRAIVEIAPGLDSKSIIVSPPPSVAASVGRSTVPDRSSITEEDFYARLRAIKPELASMAAEAIREAPSHGLEVEWRKNGPIFKYFDDSSGEFLNFGQLAPDGTLGSSGWFSGKSNRLELPDTVWRDYYKKVAAMLPNSQLREWEDKGVPGNPWCLADANGDDVEFEPLLRRRQEWFVAIDSAIALAKQALARLAAS